MQPHHVARGVVQNDGDAVEVGDAAQGGGEVVQEAIEAAARRSGARHFEQCLVQVRGDIALQPASVIRWSLCRTTRPVKHAMMHQHRSSPLPR